MAEVTAKQAGEILSISYVTIHRRADDGSLQVRREGKMGMIWVNIDELRRFANEYNYRFDEALATQYAK
jgi:predicted site-specific integrase-resolvase